MAAHALPRILNVQGPAFLCALSASRFVAGLLASACAGKTIALPAHAQPAYLAELGCAPDALLTDEAFEERGGEDAELTIALEDPLLVLFTSGSTNAPKRVEKNLSRLEIVREVDAAAGRPRAD